MKYYLFLILFLFSNSFQSQEVNNTLILKKCRKDFNKKSCLSDEDQDGILFYLDRCPKEKGFVENNGCPWPDQDKDGIIDKDDACPEVMGPAENNGCPWPDTDGDGILDKDDNCPTVPGLEEYIGCPKPYQRDCAAEKRKDSLDMIKLRADYKDIDKIYNLLSRKILEPINKYNLKNIRLHIDLIYWGPMDIVGNGCAPDWRYIPSNYLTTKFWNASTLEYFYNRKNINWISFSTKMPEQVFPDLKEFLDPSLYDYLVKHSIKNEPRIMIIKDNKKQDYTFITIKIYFQDPYKLTISVTDSNRFNITNVYEYNGKDWNKTNQ